MCLYTQLMGFYAIASGCYNCDWKTEGRARISILVSTSVYPFGIVEGDSIPWTTNTTTLECYKDWESRYSPHFQMDFHVLWFHTLSLYFVKYALTIGASSLNYHA